LPWYNSQYTLPVEKVYQELTQDKDLEQIFTLRYPRKVNKDNTVRFKGKIYQLSPMDGVKSFSGKWLEVCEYEDGKITILFENKNVSFLESQNKVSIDNNNDEILNKREYFPITQNKPKCWKPPTNHPWRISYECRSCDISNWE